MGRKSAALRVSTSNVLRIWHAATDAERDHGARWYLKAWNVAETLDPEDPARAAGVIAAMSPRVPWARNVEIAQYAYETGSAIGTGLKGNALKADAILAGAEPLSVLGGDKVRAFYRCILGDRTAVCIDRHAFDIAMGRVTNDKSRARLSRVGAYDQVARCYVRAAQVISAETGETVTGAQVQAVTWVAWRRLKGLSESYG